MVYFVFRGPEAEIQGGNRYLIAGSDIHFNSLPSEQALLLRILRPLQLYADKHGYMPSNRRWPVLDRNKKILTEAGRNWLQKHYPQGIVWEYDPDKPFKLHSSRARWK